MSRRGGRETVQHKKTILCMAVVCLLAAACAWTEHTGEQQDAAVVTRQEESGSQETRTFRYRLDDGEQEELTLQIQPVERSAGEAQELLEEAATEWEEEYLGENAEANAVRTSLYLPTTLCDSLVKVTYESSDYRILSSAGEITNEEVEQEGELVTLTATFTYRDLSRIETRSLLVLPPETGSESWLKSCLEKEAQANESATRGEDEFSLPQTIDGHTVTWIAGKETPKWALILVLGLAAVICLEMRGREEEQKRKKEREKCLMAEYPQMVEQLALLLGSGMNIRGAWERVLRTDQRMRETTGRPTRVFIEEMWITWRELSQGQSERKAYENFGSRIGLLPYRRFSSILAQNLSRGTRDIQKQLTTEAKEALEMRRNRARQLGEEAGTKLLFPMMLMFVMLLVILLLPAVTLL